MCGCECCIYAKSMHSYFLTWRDSHINHLKDRIYHAQNTRSGGLSSRVFEIYRNSVVPHGCHIYKFYCIYGCFKNVSLSLITSWDSTLEMCITML